jgi:pyruvate dehydrogenase E1 component beta subunit
VATAAEEMTLEVPPRRVTRADVPISYAVELELAALPSHERLAASVRAVATEVARR